MDFCLLKKFGKKLLNVYDKYGRKIVKKCVTAGNFSKNSAKKFNQSKYGQTLKKEGSKFGKLAGKQLSEKIIPAAVDLAGSRIADKITSLKKVKNQKN